MVSWPARPLVSTGPQVAETASTSALWAGVPEPRHGAAPLGQQRCQFGPGARDGGAASPESTARGDGVAIHREDLGPERVIWWQWIRTVAGPTAIMRCIASDAPTYLARQALERAGRTSLPAAGRRGRAADPDAWSSAMVGPDPENLAHALQRVSFWRRRRFLT